MAINGGSDYKVSAEDSLNLVEALGYGVNLMMDYISSLCAINISNIFLCSMVVTELPLDQARSALEKLCLLAASPLEVRHLDFLHGCYNTLLIMMRTIIM